MGWCYLSHSSNLVIDECKVNRSILLLERKLKGPTRYRKERVRKMSGRSYDPKTVCCLAVGKEYTDL